MKSTPHMILAVLSTGLLAALSSCSPTPQPAVLVPHVSSPDYVVLPKPVSRTPAPVRISPPDIGWECEGYRPWRYIVIHHSATPRGSAAEFDQFHRDVRGWDELGYHFVITNGQGGPDGQVQVGSRWKVQKWGAHTGGTPQNEYNEYGIGICLVGNFTSSLPTEAQMNSLRELLDYLTVRYAIPTRNIIGHRDAPDAKTQCPGEAFWKHMHEEMNLGS